MSSPKVHDDESLTLNLSQSIKQNNQQQTHLQDSHCLKRKQSNVCRKRGSIVEICLIGINCEILSLVSNISFRQNITACVAFSTTAAIDERA